MQSQHIVLIQSRFRGGVGQDAAAECCQNKDDDKNRKQR
jgi:hypothetical protein